MAYGGFWDSVKDFIGTLGISGTTAAASARAFASPTLANIRAVEKAFVEEGTSAPPELMDQLYQRYYSAIASNPYAQTGGIQSTMDTALPYLLLGGLALFLMMQKGK